MKRVDGKKILSIISTVVLFIFLGLAVASVLLTVISKLNAKNYGDDAVSIFGYQMRVVETDSMGKSDGTDVSGFEIKSIPQYSMIFIETVPDDKAEAEKWYDSLKVGDVLTFKYVYTQQVTITHRIVAISEAEQGGLKIELEGDNKGADEDLLKQVIYTADSNSPNYVVGKVTSHNYLLGLLLSFLKSPLGIIFIIIVPCIIIIVYEVVRIVNLLTAEKKQQKKDEEKAKEDELNELRRRLAELESKKE